MKPPIDPRSETVVSTRRDFVRTASAGLLALGLPSLTGCATMRDMTASIAARRAETLTAVLEGETSLRYVGAQARPELPAHLRAGSAVRRWGGRLVVVQDDVHALGFLDEVTGDITALLLPPGADGSHVFGDDLGNKALKMDLEACVTLPDGRLVALGSGSTPARERLVVVGPAGDVRQQNAHALYAAMHARPEFTGSELNIEGATVVGAALLLFQRGNGAPRDGRLPVNAVGRMELGAFVSFLDGGPAPVLGDVVQVDLGQVGRVRFGFTDACTLPDGRVAFLAGAEDSPDTYRDGQVVGCRFGLLDGSSATYTDVQTPDGSGSRLKLEGLDFVAEHPDGTLEFVVVADMDDPHVPALRASLRVRGAATTPTDAPSEGSHP
ncbi:MAG: hypothetical protein IPI43_32985 [Sandaracinaceae bacterium]|nr:hypothetical protein [Sandaracinaceae bacterium]